VVVDFVVVVVVLLNGDVAANEERAVVDAFGCNFAVAFVVDKLPFTALGLADAVTVGFKGNLLFDKSNLFYKILK
jgi:hypothetical protein